MDIPDPLPDTVPIGTKIICDSMDYISLSIGKLDITNTHPKYIFSNCRNVTAARDTKEVAFYPYRILWNELPSENIKEEVKEEVKENLSVYCSWCKKEIDNGMTICSSHESKCEIYWNALKERMVLSYLSPNDALEYDRACVKNFIDNKESK